ncbi:MAG: MBL fold metallo-hydrolase [Alphaproteobacteria bacterium]|jgi:glyoxylase-like metal-dependent hydrolase (beta-lactamase superfamily II)|nr:MBL fold metallo-hydrolase [Alphaproteobacteria bacterium]MDP6565558.1 MBL fold metallo-hydrolase [Alphaproteobacteria bacterium]MDP6812097.1 MBL fold metallo-hydrolase [Alphaproteobacteria bacterium]
MNQLAIGEATVDRVEDMPGPSFRLTTMFPDFDPAVFERHRDWLVPNYVNVEKMALVMSLHSWVIRVGGLTVLVDTCIGNDKDRLPAEPWHQRQGPYLERLAAAGVRPEQVDLVMCTHLHPDHVGWNTQMADGRWLPTFPNAKYLFSRTEYEHFQAKAEDMDRQCFEDSVLPIVEHEQAEMTEGAHAIDPGMLIEPAPGHTPGHITLKLESGGDAAIFTGDILHHPLQVYRPDWNSRFCALPDEARRTRRAVLEHCVERGALLMPAHFGAPHCCHVHREGESFGLAWHHG